MLSKNVEEKEDLAIANEKMCTEIKRNQEMNNYLQQIVSQLSQKLAKMSNYSNKAFEDMHL